MKRYLIREYIPLPDNISDLQVRLDRRAPIPPTVDKPSATSQHNPIRHIHLNVTYRFHLDTIIGDPEPSFPSEPVLQANDIERNSKPRQGHLTDDLFPALKSESDGGDDGLSDSRGDEGRVGKTPSVRRFCRSTGGTRLETYKGVRLGGPPGPPVRQNRSRLACTLHARPLSPARVTFGQRRCTKVDGMRRTGGTRRAMRTGGRCMGDWADDWGWV